VCSGARLRTFEGHDRGLACIEFKAGLIVSGSNDCKIKVWDAHTGACVRTLVGHTALVRALAFDPQAGRLVSAGYDRTVKVWDLARGTLVREFRGEHASHIFDVRFDVRRIVRCVRGVRGRGWALTDAAARATTRRSRCSTLARACLTQSSSCDGCVCV
jgi:F-box and WD-40 domain protein 1/11